MLNLLYVLLMSTENKILMFSEGIEIKYWKQIG